MSILKAKCAYCHDFLINRTRVRFIKTQISLIDAGELCKAIELKRELNVLVTPKGEPDTEKQSELLDYYDKYISNINRDFKDSLLFSHSRQYRSTIINDFIKTSPNFCENCGAPKRKYKTDNKTRIFLCKFSSKQLAKMPENHGNISSAIGKTIIEGMQGIDINLNEESDNDSESDSDSEIDDNDKKIKTKELQYITPYEIENQLAQLWKIEGEICNLIWGRPGDYDKGYSIFFIRALPVPPNRFRPPQTVGDLIAEHPQNVNLSQILILNQQLLGLKTATRFELRRGIKKENEDDEKIETPQEVERTLSQHIEEIISLQENVNAFIDSSTTTLKTKGIGIRQLLEKKEGLFRKNMMGKRVNFACRSVISPDPNLDTDEIGLPVKFAISLCYPTYVTSYNINKLREYIINGADVYPGALYIEDQNGRMLSLKNRNLSQRKALSRTLLINAVGNEKPKRVWRHLMDGDMVLVNRQPTLHKPSIMAMRAKVLKTKRQTIRMHYSNCNSFNADFDGDEINVHFPQNEISRSEGYNIASAIHQYLSPKDGSPLRGIIQDSVSSALLLTKRDSFFTREMYQELVYGSLIGLRKEFTARKVTPITPAILKPKILYTGKQIITTILNQITGDLPGLNYDGRCKVQDKQWGIGGKYSGEAIMGEQQVLIINNTFVSGILDKSCIGASSYSVIHAIYEIYGPLISAAVLSAFARLFMIYFQYAGFTCGMDDLILTESADKKRKEIIEGSLKRGVLAGAEFTEIQKVDVPTPVLHTEVRKTLQSKMLRDGMNEVNLEWDGHMRGVVAPISSDIIKACLPLGLVKGFPRNYFSTMVTSGAKGSLVNHSQISCCLGQQELEGRRVPIMVSGKSLPSFPSFDPDPRSGGFIADRFLTGIRPQEYYFHCMAGREGLVDTAVKTSRSGYLQRCVMKSLEDLTVKYDYSVRGSGGNIIELLYGDDCMEVGGTSYLLGKDSEFKFLAKNYKSLVQKYQLNTISIDNYGIILDDTPQQFALIEESKKMLNSGLEEYQPDNIISARKRINKKEEWKIGNIMKGWYDAKIIDTLKEGDNIYYKLLYSDNTKDSRVPGKIIDKKTNALIQLVKIILPDTVQSKFPIGQYLGCIGENIYEKIKSYCERNPDQVLGKDDPNKIDPEVFELLMWLKCIRGEIPPGESVGCIAAQSIGEPATQMTLNTFHLAGHGAVNVTMGIPRLREIIMTASRKITTPLMELPLKPEVTMSDAKALANSLYKLKFSDLLDPKQNISVISEVVPRTSRKLSYVRRYSITLKFIKAKAIKEEYDVDVPQLIKIISGKFCPALLVYIIKLLKKSRSRGIKVTKQSNDKLDNDDEDNVDEEKEISENKDKGEYKDYDEERKQSSKKEIVGYEDDEPEEVNRKEIFESDNEIDEDILKSKNIEKSETDESPSLPYLAKGYEEIKCDASVSKNAFFNGLLYNEKKNRAVLFINVDPNVQKLLMVQICEKVSEQTIISSVTGINRSVVLPQEGSNIVLQTDGVNFQEIWKRRKLVDINHVVCNDIGLILDIFGVEAARNAIINEINRVFSVYGIHVDPRHLGLVADYMTYKGGYTAMNRIGLSDHESPFLQMSYETTSQFLTKAALYGHTDKMETPSARISVGEVIKCGTGSFDIFQPIEINT